MLRPVSFLSIAILICFAANAQRHLTTVMDPANSSQHNVAFNGKVVIATDADSFLLSFNDEAFVPYNYPMLSGIRLTYHLNNNPLALFQSAVFLSLTGGAPGARVNYLYRFSGTTFARIITPGSLNSNCIVYGDHLYFLSRVSGVTRLYRYNGTVSEVTGASIPNAGIYKLHAAGGFLYITGAGSASLPGTVTFIRRYNGTAFLTLPYSGPHISINEVYAVPFTTRIYFTSNERIHYYNGSSVIQVFYNVGESTFTTMWGNNLYFTTARTNPSTGIRTTYLYRLMGSALTLLALPGGAVVAPIPHTNPVVYNDRLYVGAVYPDGSKQVLRYDGATFTPFFAVAASVITGLWLFVREGNLMIHPNYVNGSNAFEYNGSTFTEIIAPAGRILFPYMNSTACNHLWLNYYVDGSDLKWAYAKESKGCPPPAEPVIVIPEHFRDYERFDITTYGPERGWCWSDIIIDWEIVPVCELPPCPDPNYEARMINANNGIAWSAKFNKPSTLAVPLADQQAYRTILSSIDAQKDLLVFEPNLVTAGIASVTLSMKPKQNYFLISATTRNKAVVPIKATLLDAQGKVLWEESFTAPFSKQITANVQQPGQKLVISVPQFITRR